MSEVAVAEPKNLPVGPVDGNGIGLWGVGTLIVTEAALFAYLLFSYFYTGATAPVGWLLDPAPDLTLALPAIVLLLVSSVVAWIAERGIINGRPAQALAGFAVAFVMGVGFLCLQWLDWRSKGFGIGSSSYGSLYFVTTGFDVAHVIAGLAVLAALFLWTALGYFSPRRRVAVAAGILYWHFAVVVCLFVFATFYVTPYLGFGR
jgi:heme/copper-type cytochrome/quinol oxidase subunit 3